MFGIRATGPREESLTVILSDKELREIIRDAIYTGVRASQEIEGEPLGPYDPPPIESVPENLLTTN